MNYCILTGHVVSIPELITFGEETPATVFVLQLPSNHTSAGRITVVCRQLLALVAAKNLAGGEYVAVEGYICQGQLPWQYTENKSEVHLTALDILRCEGFRLK